MVRRQDSRHGKEQRPQSKDQTGACRISGPLWIERSARIHLELLDTTLAFEYSTVDAADITGRIDSVLNPSGGVIRADSIAELILEKDKVDPAAILTFLFAFSWFGITENSASGNGWLVVVGVFMGAYLWWGGLSAAVALARKKKKTGSLQKMDQIFGAVLSLFGVLVFIRALPI